MRRNLIDFLIPYLKVLIVAIPRSIVSGVRVRSCETSRGAILAKWNFSLDSVFSCGDEAMRLWEVIDGFTILYNTRIGRATAASRKC